MSPLGIVMNIGALSLLVLAVVCLIGTTGCGREVSQPTVAAPETHSAAGVSSEGELPLTAPDADVISTVTLTGHGEQGRKKWEVRGDTADLAADVVELSPVAATSYGRTQVDLTADHGKLVRETQDVELDGHVVIITSDGTRLVTESLDWMADSEQISTEAPITITREGMVVIGVGGSGYPNRNRMRLEREVQVTLSGEKGPTVVTCDGPMEVDTERMKIRFWNNVLVKEAKGMIRSDRLDVDIHPETHEMEHATFWGHVRIDRGEQTAYAHRAHYWQREGRMALVGHPKVETAAEEFRS